MTPRATFGPAVLLGLGAGALCAVAGTRDWVVPDIDRDNNAAGGATLWDSWVVDAPLAGALALVVLASWGVVLVTRGRVRRLVALLALLGSVGLVVTTVWLGVEGPDTLRDTLDDPSARAVLAGQSVEPTYSGWFWASVVGAPLSVVAAGIAVRFAPHWPEMGSRYDAPTGGRDTATTGKPTNNLDLWKAIDEGEDPTA